ncbi:spore coat protein X [Melghiribacillus thermohalophilus]|uniref:Spore coat protein X n=1 Tax=Melghiribacillus thermohalophilus TaxID=1324956 RepID=A0A4R3NBB6_9BACI|nr:spore coat protein [Melghiribacillus thermohalophilus]TCT25659.1 spore coat protein X [Melghiribacillus thermohalophilus]
MGESRVWKGDKPEVGADEVRSRKWNALDPTMAHPLDDDVQDAEEKIQAIQKSFESIIIKDSADVEVTTTDTQAAVNLQVALQAAIALIISLSIADSERADEVTQDLVSKIKTSQINQQQTYIENSRGVKVTTTDTDISVNIQLLLQVLITLAVRVNIL